MYKATNNHKLRTEELYPIAMHCTRLRNKGCCKNKTCNDCPYFLGNYTDNQQRINYEMMQAQKAYDKYEDTSGSWLTIVLCLGFIGFMVLSWVI